MSTLLRTALLVAAAAALVACAASPTVAPPVRKHAAPIEDRAKSATTSASRQTTKPLARPSIQPQVRTAPVIANLGAPSSSPAVVEAAGLKPEIGSRPGGPLLQPKDDPAQRRIQIQRGDKLSGIARRYSVNLAVLAAANHLPSSYALEPGRAIYLPAPNLHVVERGETFYGIARRFSVDTRSLALMNALPRPWIVYPGDEILLPPGADEIGQLVKPAIASSRDGARDGARDSAKPEPTRQPRAAIPGAGPGFIWPVAGRVLKPYGEDGAGQQNDGLDIAAEAGVEVRAAASGEVVYAGDELSGFGNLVLIRHAEGWISAYANAESLLVKEGEKVVQGQPIARAGATGSAHAPQVHFELRRGKGPVDPAQYLPARG